MNTLMYSLIIVLSINAMLILTQTGMNSVDPQAQQIYSGNGVLEQHNMNSSDPLQELPSKSGSVNTDTGNFFIDITGSALNWLAQTTGLDTFIAAVKAPYTFLLTLGFPVSIAQPIAALWYLVTLALIVLVIWGRSY